LEQAEQVEAQASLGFLEEIVFLTTSQQLEAVVVENIQQEKMEVQAVVVGRLAPLREAHRHKQQLMPVTHLLVGVMLVDKAVAVLQVKAVAAVALEPLV
tara:strand:- start:344 stop:640 length:297 start_codon:yes stop_codon:yes gene_type:complete